MPDFFRYIRFLDHCEDYGAVQPEKQAGYAGYSVAALTFAYD